MEVPRGKPVASERREYRSSDEVACSHDEVGVVAGVGVCASGMCTSPYVSI